MPKGNEQGKDFRDYTGLIDQLEDRPTDSVPLFSAVVPYLDSRTGCRPDLDDLTEHPGPVDVDRGFVVEEEPADPIAVAGDLRAIGHEPGWGPHHDGGCPFRNRGPSPVRQGRPGLATFFYRTPCCS